MLLYRYSVEYSLPRGSGSKKPNEKLVYLQEKIKFPFQNVSEYFTAFCFALYKYKHLIYRILNSFCSSAF